MKCFCLPFTFMIRWAKRSEPKTHIWMKSVVVTIWKIKNKKKNDEQKRRLCRILMVFFSCGFEYVFVCLFIFIVFHESFFPRKSLIIYFAPYSVSLHMQTQSSKIVRGREREPTCINKHTHRLFFYCYGYYILPRRVRRLPSLFICLIIWC